MSTRPLCERRVRRLRAPCSGGTRERRPPRVPAGRCPPDSSRVSGSAPGTRWRGAHAPARRHLSRSPADHPLAATPIPLCARPPGVPRLSAPAPASRRDLPRRPRAGDRQTCIVSTNADDCLLRGIGVTATLPARPRHRPPVRPGAGPPPACHDGAMRITSVADSDLFGAPRGTRCSSSGVTVLGDRRSGPPAAAGRGRRAGHGPGRGPGVSTPVPVRLDWAPPGRAGGRGGRGYRRARRAGQPAPGHRDRRVPGGPGGAGGRDPGGRDRLDHVDGQAIFTTTRSGGIRRATSPSPGCCCPAKDGSLPEVRTAFELVAAHLTRPAGPGLTSSSWPRSTT